MNIQMQPGWRTHTPNDGSQIGGVQPTNWAWWAGPPVGNTAAVLAVEGPAYATVEAYLLLPRIIAPSLCMSFDLTVLEPSLISLDLIETDLKRFDGKFVQNYSMQRLFANTLDVSDVAGNWTDTGIQPAPLVPGVPTHHKIYYATTPDNHYGTQAVVLDGILHLVKPHFQWLTQQPSTWTAGELIQLQITLGNAPGRASIVIDNLTLEAV